MSSISDIFAREILDSRGVPTLEVDVLLSSGAFGRASVPAETSAGPYEAVGLRDGEESRYMGLGVRRAAGNVNDVLGPELEGMDADEQGDIDRTMAALDGTPNMSNLGANSLLGVSLAVARAAAVDHSVPLYQYLGGIEGNVLPVPLMSVITAGTGPGLRALMVCPLGAESFSGALRVGVETYHALGKALEDTGRAAGVGNDGGFVLEPASDREMLDMVMRAVESAGHEPGRDVSIALDAGAGRFFEDGLYSTREGKKLEPEGMVEYFADLAGAYPVVSIEDGMDPEDWDGWKSLTERLGSRVQLVGGDLFATGAERLAMGIDRGAGNALSISPARAGTLTRALEVIELARGAGYGTVASNLSGETDDSAVADIAVGCRLGQVKAGAPCRGEHVAEYNQLLRIEENLCDDARFGGPAFSRRFAGGG